MATIFNSKEIMLLGLKGKDGVDGVNGKDGINGQNGKDGAKGEKGDPFVYSDFTPEQLEELKKYGTLELSDRIYDTIPYNDDNLYLLQAVVGGRDDNNTLTNKGVVVPGKLFFNSENYYIGYNEPNEVIIAESINTKGFLNNNYDVKLSLIREEGGDWKSAVFTRAKGSDEGWEPLDMETSGAANYIRIYKVTMHGKDSTPEPAPASGGKRLVFKGKYDEFLFDSDQKSYALDDLNTMVLKFNPFNDRNPSETYTITFTSEELQMVTATYGNFQTIIINIVKESVTENETKYNIYMDISATSTSKIYMALYTEKVNV